MDFRAIFVADFSWFWKVYNRAETSAMIEKNVCLDLNLLLWKTSNIVYILVRTKVG